MHLALLLDMYNADVRPVLDRFQYQKLRTLSATTTSSGTLAIITSARWIITVFSTCSSPACAILTITGRIVGAIGRSCLSPQGKVIVGCSAYCLMVFLKRQYQHIRASA